MTTALPRHTAEAIRLRRARGRLPMGREVTAWLYESLTQYAAGLGTAVTDVPGPCDPADRTRADEHARHLAETAEARLRSRRSHRGGPGVPGGS
ncbi:hypothetical protein ACFVUH_20405 [Kitasatospora sp. NPDC058032]|uniref:hypothetical protein n=1 Tax=Kitasatospora sp. NPDC058032 TaxID=3346307 RepID=UPI0036D7E786